MDFAKIAVEALVFLAVAAAAAAVAYAVAARLLRRVYARPGVATAVAVLVSFVITEVWAQVSGQPRYAGGTMLICGGIAAAAMAAQARPRDDAATTAL